MKSIKVCEYSRSRSFHDDLILQDQASGERSQDQWSSGFFFLAQLHEVHRAIAVTPVVHVPVPVPVRVKVF